MLEKNHFKNSFQDLSKAVENSDPNAAEKIRQVLNSSEDPSEMRYLEGLLMMLGESIGELEDPPDIEDDIEEYWEEY
tara:strand:- start:467 stop:697 length:231 start_codon:yes stop_codon:yes gene_type:complete